jgi:hypothetical protein
MALFSTPLLAEYPVEMLQLNGHSAEKVIPVIKKFIDKDGSVASMNDQLIVRTSPDNLKLIKKILDNIDKPARPLVIYVRQGSGEMQTGPARLSTTRADVEADSGRIIGLPGDRGTVKPGQIIGLPSRGAPAGRRGIQADTRSDRDQTQRVQVVEGKPAYIETGTQVPIYDGATGVGLYGYGEALRTRYKNATTGFYALARTSGDQVTVEISAQQIQQGTTNDRFDARRTRTTISGRLGEWMPLGGTSRGGFNDQKQGGINASTTSNQDYALYLMVQALD